MGEGVDAGEGDSISSGRDEGGGGGGGEEGK